MASHDITLNIGSKFKGEGLERMSEALNANKKEISAARQGVTELKKAFSEVSPEASKAIGGVENLAKAFVSGGIVGGAIQIAIMGIAEAVSYCTERMKEAKESAVKWASIIRNEVVLAMEKATGNFSQLKQEIQQVNKENEDLLKVLNSKSAQEAKNKIFEINQQKLQDLANAMTEEEKKVIEETAKQRIAMVQATLAEEQSANAIKTASDKVTEMSNLKEASAQNLYEAENNLAELTKMNQTYLSKKEESAQMLIKIENDYKNGVISYGESIKRKQEVTLEISKVEEQYKEQSEQLQKATQIVESARKESSDAEYAYTQACEALSLAVGDKKNAEQATSLLIQEAETKRIEAERKAVEENQNWLDTVQNLRQKLDEQTNTTQNFDIALQELNDILEGSATAEEELADETKKLTERRKKQGQSVDENSSGKDGIPVKVTNAKEIRSSSSANSKTEVNWNPLSPELKKPKKLDNETWYRIQRGVANVADFKRLDRYTQNEEHAQEEKKRIRADTTQYLKLYSTPKALLSKTDLEFKNIYEQKIIPKIGVDVAKKLMGEQGKKLLNSEQVEGFLGRNGSLTNKLNAIQEKLNAMGCK